MGGLDVEMKQLLQLMRSLSCDVLAVLVLGWVIVRIRILDSQFGIQVPASAGAPRVRKMTLGAVLVFVCVAVFGIWGRGTPSLLALTSQLVTFGPYRYVRNPIHVGQVTFFIGLGLYLRSIAVLLFSLTWLLFCHLFVVLIEEGSLRGNLERHTRNITERCRDVYPPHRSAKRFDDTTLFLTSEQT
jgi:protein-S-isoprenylcysteine O-methyltransferase Ste14